MSASTAFAVAHSEGRPGGGKVTSREREQRNQHPGAVIWLTGLSGAGKTTVATELERHLFQSGRQAYLLDGDVLRRGLCSDLGFTADARTENIRRAGEVAALLADAGLIVIAAFISPSRADRARVRSLLPTGRFLEVFVDAPLEVCERRDVKGLYARARANQIKEFTGISAPYEPPEQAEIVLPTHQMTPAEAVETVVKYLSQEILVPAGPRSG